MRETKQSNMMAGRVQELAATLVSEYDGDAGRLWSDGADLATVQKRLGAIKGFGPGKCAMIGEVLDLFGHRQF